MATSKFLRRILIAAAVVAIGGMAIVAAQSASNAAGDPLLQEVRALRADVNHAASTGIRAQLLIARLQSQEQRINVLSGQLTDLRRQLTTQRSGRSRGRQRSSRVAPERVPRSGAHDPASGSGTATARGAGNRSGEPAGHRAEPVGRLQLASGRNRAAVDDSLVDRRSAP